MVTSESMLRLPHGDLNDQDRLRCEKAVTLYNKFRLMEQAMTKRSRVKMLLCLASDFLSFGMDELGAALVLEADSIYPDYMLKHASEDIKNYKHIAVAYANIGRFYGKKN